MSSIAPSLAVDGSRAEVRGARWPLRALIVVLLLALIGAMVRLAWLSDDAFITFRCVENVADGLGPRWNAADRVQAFTHPLWFGALVVLRLATGELPTSAMWFGIALSAAAIVWALRLCREPGARVLLLVLLLGSRGWLDYTTSGLENPLSSLLVVALVAALQLQDRVGRAFAVAVVTGLLAVTRLDLLVFGGPALVAALVRIPLRLALRALVLGFLPLVAWSLFATIYYGSPFPITAFAKAFAHGVPRAELLAKGWHYLGVHLTADPIALPVIAGGIAAGLLRPGSRALASGLAGYLAYVVYVGGDYMLGRFLTPCLVLGAWLLARAVAERGRTAWIAVALIAAGFGCARGWPAWLRGFEHDRERALVRRDDGMADERTYYWALTGLWSPWRLPLVAGFHSANLRAAGETAPRIDVIGSVGMAAWVDGDLVHVVDPWLLDPLLMRLPVGDPDDWRIGHFYRRIPAGYLESLATGENRIEHAGLARVWDAVRSATRDPLFAAERWRHLWSLWTGALDGELAAFVAADYRHPPRIVLPLAAFAAPLPAGTPWYRHAPARSCAGGGIAVQLPEPAEVAAVVLHLGGAADYEVELRRAGTVRHRAQLRVEAPPFDGMVPMRVEVPRGTGAIDELWLTSRAPVALPLAPFLGRVELERR